MIKTISTIKYLKNYIRRETLLWRSRGRKRRRRGLKAYMKIKRHLWEKKGEAN